MKKILIIDDDAQIRTQLSDILKGEGYSVETAAAAREGIDMIRKDPSDIALLDLMMPRMSGMDALAEIRKLRARTKVIMITAFASVENAVDAIKRGASDYISKPFKIAELLTTIRRVLEEAKFEEKAISLDVDHALTSLASPIRRNVLKSLAVHGKMRMMEITRGLGIEDHTKILFHLKILKEAGIIEQDDDKLYSLTPDGLRTVDCLKTIESYMS